jgi:hypothetical protein
MLASVAMPASMITSAPAGGVQSGQHASKRAGFADIAFEGLRAAHKATAVEHQAERHQRAVAALLLGTGTLGLAITRNFAFKIRVGQVVERDRLFQAKERANGAEQARFNHFPMLHQDVRSTVKTHVRHRQEVDVDQLAQGALLLQPAPGRPLGARAAHSPDDAQFSACRPTCSTPTERGCITCSESISTSNVTCPQRGPPPPASRQRDRTISCPA